MMKKLAVIILVIVLIVSCRTKKAEVFTDNKPYALEIKKERSYFQSQKIAERLTEMGLSAYVIEKSDSVDGKWFCVLSGALENADSVSSYRQKIEHEFRLFGTQIINYANLDSITQVSVKRPNVVVEQKRIVTEKPNVPIDVFETIRKYPRSNALYLDQINIVYIPQDSGNKGVDILKEKESDLVNNILLNKLSESGTVFSKARFIDNLYGDRITLYIGKLKPPKYNVVKASFAPESHDKQFDIAKEYARLLAENKEKEETRITIDAYMNLYGYKVAVKEKQGSVAFYFLVDGNSEFVYFVKSTDRVEKDILKLLSEIGNGEGLLEYDEFYNSFNVIPDNSQEHEVFLGLFVDKLSWEYAKAKDNAKWAQEMVGHWFSSTYFYNTENGVWGYNIFDLLTEGKQKYIYSTLYSSGISEKYKRSIYGVTGNAIYGWYDYLSEINFAIDRFVCALNGSRDFKEEDLIVRGESIQFKKGGYPKRDKGRVV